jgi:predicted signal transduction protein with EAL and GGDEF domain
LDRLAAGKVRNDCVLLQHQGFCEGTDALDRQIPSAAAALQIAERIRRDFAAHPTPYDDELIVHTLCCGVAEVFSARVQLSAREMMQHADAALYQAKATGRNQSHLYDPAKGVVFRRIAAAGHPDHTPTPETEDSEALV